MWLTPYRKYRILEMIPGILIWTTFIAGIFFSIYAPLWMIFFAILFDLYWLLRVVYFVIYLSFSWRQYLRDKRVDWMARVQEHDQWRRIKHLIFLPTVDEDIDILRASLDGLVHATYPQSSMVVVLAGEERRKDEFLQKAELLRTEYERFFDAILITIHPKDVPGEIASKGANLHYAGKEAQAYVDQQGWSYADVIVSAFDSDTVVHPHYFACLTATYLSHPNPTRSSYQPLALYNNNVWESPSFTRVVANSTTFWLMAELARPKPLWTFSSHSMPFQALVDVGFWQNDIVTEDSRIFLQCFIHYDGEYTVTPMYIPVSMNTAHAGQFWSTVKNLYKQQRRWAWGSEHFPFMIWHFWNSPLPRKKWRLVFNLAEGMYSWATVPILITVLGYLPLLMLDDVDKASTIAQYTPHILETLMKISMVGIFISAILNVYLLPTDIPGSRWKKIGLMMAQWILLPIVLIAFGSIPATEAQTRLMLGKYLGFDTAKKINR